MATTLSGDKRTVLIVEDNEMNREILCELLMDDYNILEAENGLDGLRKLTEHSEVSAILLDVFMPVCDGFGFLEKKKELLQYDSVPVIVMTGSGAVEDEIRCLSLGATDFVTKPYNIEVLKNRIESVIRLRESAAMLGQAELDELTQLYNKEFFYYNADEYMRVARDKKLDIICTDIENFRAMNERYGRDLCDQFLKYLAGQLGKIIPGVVMGGRIGADIFAFLIEHRDDPWTDVLSHDHDGWSRSHFTMKYGINAEVDHDTSASVLCDHATLAIENIKNHFTEKIAWYDDELRKQQLREHQIVENMQAALDNREFTIYFQPKYDIRANHVGGAEALVRWIHPEMGFISPGVFIPLFEQNGFITKLDFYIWDAVCREIRNCLDKGIPAVPVSMNVSRLDFELPDLAEQITALVDRYGIDHSLLHIELTESAYGDDPASIADTLRSLHDKGFLIELDDFGSGYSSLSSLNTLTLDVMKLDMSLIRQARVTKDYSILRFAILLADGLRLKTVAEGVEYDEEVSAMKVLGCDYIQGYYFSKPLSGDEFEKYLCEHSA